MEQANREAGWDLEYRQLVGGDFSARYAVQECSKTLLMRERYDCSLEIQGKLAEDAVTVIIPRNPDKSAKLTGSRYWPDDELNATPK